MYIKHLKPKKNGRFKQGYINPESCKKLYENLKNEPIIYRSSWERKFITWCETSPKVVAWGSECIHIPYYNPVDQKTHNYYPDFVVELVNGDTLVVEIKPENQTVRPTTDNSWAARTYAVNRAKWREIEQRCKEKGFKFCILTEKTIKKL